MRGVFFCTRWRQPRSAAHKNTAAPRKTCQAARKRCAVGPMWGPARVRVPPTPGMGPPPSGPLPCLLLGRATASLPSTDYTWARSLISGEGITPPYGPVPPDRGRAAFCKLRAEGVLRSWPSLPYCFVDLCRTQRRDAAPSGKVPPLHPWSVWTRPRWRANPALSGKEPLPPLPASIGLCVGGVCRSCGHFCDVFERPCEPSAS